jgi:hypothetical protein
MCAPGRSCLRSDIHCSRPKAKLADFGIPPDLRFDILLISASLFMPASATHQKDRRPACCDRYGLRSAVSPRQIRPFKRLAELPVPFGSAAPSVQQSRLESGMSVSGQGAKSLDVQEHDKAAIERDQAFLAQRREGAAHGFA